MTEKKYGWFKDRKVKTKITILLAMLSTLVLGVGGFGSYLMFDLESDIEQLSQEALVDSRVLSQIEEGLLQERVMVLSNVTASSDEKKEEYLQNLQDARRTTDDALTKMQSWTGEDASTIEEISLMVDQYRDLIDDEYIPAVNRGDMETFEDLRDNQAAPLISDITNRVGDIAEHQQQLADEIAASTESKVSAATIEIVVIMVVGGIGALMLGLYTSKLITRPLLEVREALGEIENGDLRVQVEVRSNDEIGQMGASLNRAVSSLREAMQTVTDKATDLALQSDELSKISGRIAATAEETSVQSSSVSSAAEQVNANIQTIAAGSEEMSVAIKEVSRNANDAASIAANAVGVSEQASTAVEAMEQANVEVEGLVKTIAGLASQTNLLALNATIEAARAGEAGKGFAVVAGEVRDLSKASAEASESIAKRVSSIEAASQAVADRIREMASYVERINDYQTSIASAVEEQTATTAEIGRGINEMVSGSNEITSNITGIAASASETSRDVVETQGSANQLASMSQELKDLVSNFQV